MTCQSWVKSPRSSLRSILAKVSLEPVLFLAVLTSGMISQFLYRKILNFISVADPRHFGVDPDPDPRIHASY
jgi:hypothetical protein